MSTITKLKFGTNHRMRQAIDPIAFGRRVREKRNELGLSQDRLGQLSDYSQSNVQWAESGKAKDPRILAQDFAEPLRTTAEWLLYETGVRDTAPPPMSRDEVSESWDRLPLDIREALSQQINEALADLVKRRSRASS